MKLVYNKSFITQSLKVSPQAEECFINYLNKSPSQVKCVKEGEMDLKPFQKVLEEQKYCCGHVCVPTSLTLQQHYQCHKMLIIPGIKTSVSTKLIDTNEIKRCLLLGRKAVTNLDTVLKSRDIILPTKVHLVQAMVFLVVRYTRQSWSIKKADHQSLDAFKL